jgi:hypothetical protein
MTDRHGPRDGLPGLEGQTTDDITAGWSDADWESWFADTVEPSPRWQTLIESYDSGVGFGRDARDVYPEREFALDAGTGTVDPDLLAGVRDLETLSRNPDRPPGSASESGVPAVEPGSEAVQTPGSDDAATSLASDFSRLSTQSKQRFFNGWYRIQEDTPAAAQPVPEDVPPPVDSIVPELTPGAGLGRNWRLWAIPLVIAGFIVGWAWVGGFGSEDEARDALQTEPTVTTQGPEEDPAPDDTGSEPTSALPAGSLPDETRASGPGVMTAVATGDDPARVSAALSEVRVSLGASCRGGTILVSSGSDSEGPSGHFYPDGSGGFVWDDNTRRDVEDGVQLEDADEVRDVTLADGALSFEWTRTNFDGSTWTVPISVPAPEGAEDWWAELPAAGPAPYSAEYQVEEADGSLVVTGTTDAPDGTVFEVSLPNGDRFPVEVVDGLFDVTVPGGTGSGGSAAQVFYGGHVLGCSTG